MDGWLGAFAGYRVAVTEGRIERWLDQFDAQDRDLAARVLDCVDFIGHAQMVHAFRTILGQLEGWSKNQAQRRGRWRFVAFSSSAGESGDAMLHKFRVANGLQSRVYGGLFIHMSELVREDLGPEDTVIFVDDFSGTGNQACEGWPLIQELLPGKPSIYLVLMTASTRARRRIAAETDLTVVPHFELEDRDSVFSDKCKYFTNAEKEDLLKYCSKGDRNNPKGYGDCGFVLVFAHTCPNNTIPILHAHHTRWQGLFRRYD